MNREHRNATRKAQLESPMQTWVKFRTLHPYSRDEFSTAPEKLTKWRHHNAARMSQPEYRTITVNNNMLLKVRDMFRVNNFDDMPNKTQMKYMAISRCFPGFQVYACGSRVRGDYIHETTIGKHGLASTVSLARELAGMKVRKSSDYDFWVEPAAIQVRALPPNCDRARLRIPEKEKVAIPIFYER